MMNPSQKATINALSRACGKTLAESPISGWQHPCRGGGLQVMSDTRIRVAIKDDGTVADIDLGSYLQSSPPHGNDTPQNRFRVAVLALRFPGRTFGEICKNAGGSKAQFDNGWMPSMAAAPEKSQMIWRELSDGEGHVATNANRIDESCRGGLSVGSRCISSQVSVTHAARPSGNVCVAAHKLCSYFERDGQQRALEAYAQFAFAPKRGWGIQAKMELYEASRRAFDPSVPQAETSSAFRRIYDDLYRPARADGWGVGRKSSGPCWPAPKTFETIKTEFHLFRWGGPITLLNFHTSGDWAVLLSSLEKMREMKPLAGYPVMAVSKFLHFYNPELFPIYDNEVIKDGVFHCFKNDFREFCYTSGLQYEIGNTSTFYWKYIRWANSLLASAHSGFMEVFVDWLRTQPGAELHRRTFDVSRLYATAFEFTAIGAWRVETAVSAASA